MLVVTLTHVTSGGGSSSCSIPEPAPSLPSRLRSLGGFDQPQDPSDTTALVTFAAQAASAVAPGLIGSQPRQPVRVHALHADEPDAIVVPLLSTVPGQQRQVVAGLVSLLVDCAGRAYYSAVDDLTLKSATAPGAFPGLTMSNAASLLSTTDPQLVYTQSPFAPRWRNPDTGASIAAFSA